MATRPAHEPASRLAPCRARMTARRADELARPAQSFQVSGARRPVWEHCQELAVGLRVVAAGDQDRSRARRGVHHYRLGVEELTVYPLK